MFSSYPAELFCDGFIVRSRGSLISSTYFLVSLFPERILRRLA